MSQLYLAPSEPPELRAMGVTSGLPERKGSDVLWAAGNNLIGVQRKATNDLVASIYNGRLNHEFEKMDGLWIKVLLVEGKWKWNRDGEWTDGWNGSQKWNRAQMVGYLASVQAKGFWVIQTDGLADTITTIDALWGWSQKDGHTALDQAPKLAKADRKHWVLQVLCPGIGVEMSKRLIEANGGQLPLKVTMTADEVAAVPGWGKKRTKQLMDAFGEKGEA
jgi:ERCC4-type nuclease